MQKNNNHSLGTESVTRLLIRYAVPSIISMLVNSLYNIVDQIFIGRGIGFLGNSATTVAFPLMTISLALALLIGNGAAAYCNIEMGKGNTEVTHKILGSSITVLTLLSLLLVGVQLAFLEPILGALGATPSIMPYALDYTRYVIYGMPFSMLGIALSSIIRADGSPRFSMVSMLVGAVLNTILDPIFIFTLDMGVKGAAIATTISQIVSFLVCLLYFWKYSKSIHLRRKHLVPSWKLVRRVSAYGSSSFITQIAITLVSITLNNSLAHYGALTQIGSDIPIAAMGIVQKINSITISIILGIAIGAQPILGYNYGAGNYDRVKQVYRAEVICATIISTLMTLLFIFTPQTFVGIFGDKDPQFNQFAALCLRIYLCGVFTAGIQIPSSNYFQAVGKPLKAMVLSMSRQILLLIPSILILPLFFGLNGILFSGPVADSMAVLVSLYFIIREMRTLGKEDGLDFTPSSSVR